MLVIKDRNRQTRAIEEEHKADRDNPGLPIELALARGISQHKDIPRKFEKFEHGVLLRNRHSVLPQRHSAGQLIGINSVQLWRLGSTTPLGSNVGSAFSTTSDLSEEIQLWVYWFEVSILRPVDGSMKSWRLSE